MLNEPTLQKLHTLRLSAMAEAWVAQNAAVAASELSFDERFALLIDAEHMARENGKIRRNLKQAKLRDSTASLEDVQADTGRGIDSAKIRQLATCRWIQESQNILITGPTGVGKSFLACALGQSACRKGFVSPIDASHGDPSATSGGVAAGNRGTLSGQCQDAQSKTNPRRGPA